MEVDASDKAYDDGKEYFFKKKFKDAGTWKYTFEFRNEKNPKRSTPTVDVKVEEPPSIFPGLQAAPAAGALLLAALFANFLINKRNTGR